MEDPTRAAGLRVPYRIETDRLVLRCFEPGDAEAVLRATIASEEHLRPWIPWAEALPRDLDAKLPEIRRLRSAFDRDEQYVMAARLRDGGELIGSVGLHPRCGAGGLEIGYWVHVDHVRRGYCSEMAAATTRVGFELFRMDRMEIHCDPANAVSRRVPARLGYQLEGTLLRRIAWPSGKARDKEVWTLFAEHYAASPSASCVLAAHDLLGRRLC